MPFYFICKVVGKAASWVYRRLAQRYGGACHPNSSAEVDDTEPPCQPSIVLPQFRIDDAKGNVTGR